MIHYCCRAVGILTATLLIVGLRAPAVDAQTRVDRNITYGMYSGLALLLDVHYPEAPNGFGVLFVAGSGWSSALTTCSAPFGSSATTPSSSE